MSQHEQRSDKKRQGKVYEHDVSRLKTAAAKTPGKPYRSALQAGQYLRRILQRIVCAGLPHPFTTCQALVHLKRSYLRGNGRETQD